MRIVGGLALHGCSFACNYLRIARLRRRGCHCTGITYIHPGAQFSCPSNITIGKCCCFGKCHFYALDKIEVGDRTIIGDSVFLCTGSHDIYAEDFHLVTKPIVIGDNVWIATGATVLPGVHIGNGAIVGAMAVVSRDVPAGAVVAGNPAEIVRSDRPAPAHFNPLDLANLNVEAWTKRLRDLHNPKRRT